MEKLSKQNGTKLSKPGHLSHGSKYHSVSEAEEVKVLLVAVRQHLNLPAHNLRDLGGVCDLL